MMKLFRWRLLSRRRALILGIGALSMPIATLLARSKAIEPATRAKTLRKFTVVGRSSLQQRAKAKGLIYGAFPQANDLQFAGDLALQARFVRECATMTVGCYWVITRPSISTFDFTSTDYFVKFAQRHQIRLHGHPLVWHEVMPTWVSTLTPNNAEQILTEQIETLMRRYAGKIASWDVVNEAIDIGRDRRADGLRDTIWLKLLGEDYLDLAFRVAAIADPQAKLVYNDYGVEYDTPEDDAKREAILNLLARFKAKGTPIHALGIQSHLSVNRHPFNQAKFKKFLSSVAKLGLKIRISELDVSDDNLPVEIANRDRSIAEMYADYLAIALAEPAVISVTTWGLSDRYTWLAQNKPRPDLAQVRPLPFDLHCQPKLAQQAIAQAFDRAPKR